MMSRKAFSWCHYQVQPPCHICLGSALLLDKAVLHYRVEQKRIVHGREASAIAGELQLQALQHGKAF